MRPGDKLESRELGFDGCWCCCSCCLYPAGAEMKAYYDAHRKSLRKLLDRAAGAVVFVSTDEGAALENVELQVYNVQEPALRLVAKGSIAGEG